MADVVNKTTMEYRRSVHTPDYDKSEWLINPKIPVDAEGNKVPQKYWRISKIPLINKLVEMTEEEKAVVNSAEVEAQNEALRESLIGNKEREIIRQQAIDELKKEGLLKADGSLA